MLTSRGSTARLLVGAGPQQPPDDAPSGSSNSPAPPQTPVSGRVSSTRAARIRTDMRQRVSLSRPPRRSPRGDHRRRTPPRKPPVPARPPRPHPYRGGKAMLLTLPDGSTVTTAGAPLGELVAAQRASQPPSVISASSETPTGPALRIVLPMATVLVSIKPLRTGEAPARAGKLAGRAQAREHSWAHASVKRPDGTVREGWLRLGSASRFTASVSAEVAGRLLRGEGRPGGLHARSALRALARTSLRRRLPHRAASRPGQ